MPFQNKKINRFLLPKQVNLNGDKLKENFDLIDDYFDDIKQYVFTDILMFENPKSIEIATKARVQKLVSIVLLRSLFLKDGLVQSLNDSNFPVYYATLKSFMEIGGLLGYITGIIYDNEDYVVIFEKMAPLHLGNRGQGSLRVGSIDIPNIKTMFEKSDKIFIKEFPHDNPPASNSIIWDQYDMICNYAHPNYDAHSFLGKPNLENKSWEAVKYLENYKIESYDEYMPSLGIAICIIKHFVLKILESPKINNFQGLESKRLFT